MVISYINELNLTCHRKALRLIDINPTYLNYNTKLESGTICLLTGQICKVRKLKDATMING